MGTLLEGGRLLLADAVQRLAALEVQEVQKQELFLQQLLELAGLVSAQM